jgi:hypothetical protein
VVQLVLDEGMASVPLSQLSDSNSWFTVVGMLVIGALGGLGHLMTDPVIKNPTKKDGGSAAALGAIAGLGVLYVAAPTTLVELVGLGILSGYFAQTLLTTLGARVQAAVQVAAATEQKNQAIKDKAAAVKAADEATQIARQAPNVNHTALDEIAGRLNAIR